MNKMSFYLPRRRACIAAVLVQPGHAACLARRLRRCRIAQNKRCKIVQHKRRFNGAESRSISFTLAHPRLRAAARPFFVGTGLEPQCPRQLQRAAATFKQGDPLDQRVGLARHTSSVGIRRVVDTRLQFLKGVMRIGPQRSTQRKIFTDYLRLHHLAVTALKT